MHSDFFPTKFAVRIVKVKMIFSQKKAVFKVQFFLESQKNLKKILDLLSNVK